MSQSPIESLGDPSPNAGQESAFDHARARDEIVTAALSHVPFDGWTHETLRLGARDAGHEPVTALRVFPGGPVEAVDHWTAMADRQMLLALGEAEFASLKIRERIGLAVRRRLEAVAPHREAVRRALGLLALPQNAPVAAKTLWRTVDAIWYAAGDTATDFNYYTKRGLLSGVYSATLLYWLEDKSEDSANTWAFLDRRIADVMRVPRALGRVRDMIGGLPNPLRPFFARR